MHFFPQQLWGFDRVCRVPCDRPDIDGDTGVIRSSEWAKNLKNEGDSEAGHQGFHLKEDR
jgi:hypothetical protein